MLWTSIATGKRPFKHGIHGFSEPEPDGSRVRPVTNRGIPDKTARGAEDIVGSSTECSRAIGGIHPVAMYHSLQLPKATPSFRHSPKTIVPSE
jgi:hypothetical protein